jgi:hypothetical protein
MASLKQIQANRLNSQLCTGPRTEAGKAVSRLNALKSGIDAKLTIIPGEDPLALDQLTADYIGRYQPVTPEARALVDILITSEWQLRRLRRAEAFMWKRGMDSYKDYPFPMADTLIGQDPVFARLQRRIDATQRNFQRALAELRRLEADPPQPGQADGTNELTLVSAIVKPEAPASQPPQIGFVVPPLADPPPSGSGARQPVEISAGNPRSRS